MRRFLSQFSVFAVAVSAIPFTSSPAKAADPPFGTLANEVFFSQTGHHVSGAFLKYWWNNGGLDTFGFPLTEATDVNGIQTQYFERAIRVSSQQSGRAQGPARPAGQRGHPGPKGFAVYAVPIRLQVRKQ